MKDDHGLGQVRVVEGVFRRVLDNIERKDGKIGESNI